MLSNKVWRQYRFRNSVFFQVPLKKGLQSHTKGLLWHRLSFSNKPSSCGNSNVQEGGTRLQLSPWSYVQINVSSVPVTAPQFLCDLRWHIHQKNLLPGAQITQIVLKPETLIIKSVYRLCLALWLGKHLHDAFPMAAAFLAASATTSILFYCFLKPFYFLLLT